MCIRDSGQYARVIRAVLDRRKELNAQLVSPMLETLPEMAQMCIRDSCTASSLSSASEEMKL